jgi:hypothetical protein
LLVMIYPSSLMTTPDPEAWGSRICPKNPRWGGRVLITVTTAGFTCATAETMAESSVNVR